MKLKKAYLLFTCLLSGTMMPSAHALDLSLLGGLTLSNYATSPTPVTSPSLGVNYGVGGAVGIDLNPFFSLELGVLYMNHSYSNTPALGTTVDSRFSYLTVPVIFRFNPLSLISVGVGGYYGFGTGLTTTTTSPISTVVVSSSAPTDYGLIGTAGVRIPILPMTKIRADVLYQFGLADVGSSGTSLNSRNLDFFAGVMIDI